MQLSVSVVRQVCVVVLDVFGQLDGVPNEGPGPDVRLGALHSQPLEGHDLGVGGLPSEILDDVELALDHLDHRSPPTARLLQIQNVLRDE